MHHKHFFAGLFMVFGMASGLMACGGVDVEGSAQQGVDEEALSSQFAPSDGNALLAIGQSPKLPTCGIVACPSGTECRFDSSNVARCAAPAGMTCDDINCGQYYFCQMMGSLAVCVQGAADS